MSFCGNIEDKVIDSRTSKEGDAIRRRRECLKCGKRFTSYERVEDLVPMVVKKTAGGSPLTGPRCLKALKRHVKKACKR